MMYHVRVEYLQYVNGEKTSKPFVAQYTQAEWQRVVKNMVTPFIRFDVLFDPTKKYVEQAVPLNEITEEEPIRRGRKPRN